MLTFRNGDVLAVVNVAGEPVPVPAGATVLLRSDGRRAGDPIAADGAAWITTGAAS